MRRLTLTCGVTLLAIFLVNSASTAQTSQPAPAGGAGAGARTRPEGAGAMRLSRLQDALGKLDLSDDQKQKVSTIVEDARGKMKAIRAKVEAGATMADVRDEARQVLMDLRQKLS